MYRYRHFDDEFGPNGRNSSAILPEFEIDEPFSIQINPGLRDYSSNYNKLKFFFLQRTYLERFFIFLIILLLIVLFIIIIISLYYQKNYSINSLCLTPSCIEVSHSLYSGLNQSVDPCEDFHEFVCGRWMRSNIISRSQSAWSIIRELTQKNLIILKNILEQTSISSLNIAEQETIKYYQSCMNLTEIERLNLQPLENYFQNNLNFTLKQWINMNKNQTLQESFLFLIKYIFKYVLPIKITADEKNSSWNNIYVSF